VSPWPPLSSSFNKAVTTITARELSDTPHIELRSQLQGFSGGRFVYPTTSACQCDTGFCYHQILYSLYLNDVAAQEFGLDVVLYVDDISLFTSDVGVNRAMLKM
jgi:hypothetical protein